MAGKRGTNRADLRNRIITAAAACIETSGVANLRARDLAIAGSCALGAIYTAFEDLEAVVIAVNTQTLKLLTVHLQEAAARELQTANLLQVLAATYLNFSRQHNNRWQSLFCYQPSKALTAPGSKREENTVPLLHIFAKPLQQYLPDATEQELLEQAQIAFSTIHGIVAIYHKTCLNKLSPEAQDKALHDFVTAYTTSYLKA